MQKYGPAALSQHFMVSVRSARAARGVVTAWVPTSAPSALLSCVHRAANGRIALGCTALLPRRIRRLLHAWQCTPHAASRRTHKCQRWRKI